MKKAHVRLPYGFSRDLYFCFDIKKAFSADEPVFEQKERKKQNEKNILMHHACNTPYFFVCRLRQKGRRHKHRRKSLVIGK